MKFRYEKTEVSTVKQYLSTLEAGRLYPVLVGGGQEELRKTLREMQGKGDVYAWKYADLLMSGNRPEDMAEVYRIFADLSKKGFIPTQCCLGICYQNGRGVPKDYTKGLEWLRKAMAAGDARAHHAMGVVYSIGQVSRPIWEKPQSAFRRALS